MDRILLAAIWPVGIAVIIVAGGLLARRAPQAAPVHGDTGAAYTPPHGRRTRPAGGAMAAVRGALPTALRFLAIVAVGTVLIYGVMVLLGLVVVHGGPSIDKPILHWISAHRSHLWKVVMKHATEVGDTWTVRGAAVTAAVCLAVTWQRLRWLPALALATMQVLQRVLTSAIHHTVHRVGPPGFLHGTFPSGGSERSVVFYGLIAYLLWREFSGSRKAAIWSGTAVAVLAFNEGYSRAYLGMHWFTDVLSGWIYGGLLLALLIVAVRLVAGPRGSRARRRSRGRACRRRGAQRLGRSPAEVSRGTVAIASEGHDAAVRQPEGQTP